MHTAGQKAFAEVVEQQPLALDISANKGFDQFVGLIVVVLDRWRLHEVAGGRQDWPANLAVQGDLGGTNRIDDHTGRVRGVPDFQLVLQRYRGITKIATFQPDEGPFAVIQPGNVVGGTDVDVVVGEFGLQIGGDGLGFGDLFGLQPVAFQHVFEVHVPTNVELVGAIHGDSAGFKEGGQCAVGNGGTNLGLNVVPDDGHTGVSKFLGPGVIGSDEHRQGIDECDPGINGGLSVVLGCFFGADGQVADQNVNVVVLELLHHINRLGIRFFDGLAVILAQTIQGRATQDVHTGFGDVGEFDGVVLGGAHRIDNVEADFLGIYVKCGDKFEVGDMIIPKLNVHETGNSVLIRSVFIVFNAFDE